MTVPQLACSPVQKASATVVPEPGPGGDVRLTDKKGITTELVAFRRRVGENALHGVMGSMSIEIPLRIVRSLTMVPADGPGLYLIRLALKGDKRLEYRLPVYEEKTYYGGDAEFGEFRIRKLCQTLG